MRPPTLSIFSHARYRGGQSSALTHSLTQSAQSVSQSLTHSLSQSAQSVSQSLTHSLTQSAQSVSHSLTYSLSQSAQSVSQLPAIAFVMFMFARRAASARARALLLLLRDLTLCTRACSSSLSCSDRGRMKAADMSRRSWASVARSGSSATSDPHSAWTITFFRACICRCVLRSDEASLIPRVPLSRAYDLLRLSLSLSL